VSIRVEIAVFDENGHTLSSGTVHVEHDPALLVSDRGSSGGWSWSPHLASRRLKGAVLMKVGQGLVLAMHRARDAP
jgi:hypothetical protein